ncbi:MAG: hypothetical protein HQL22_08240 [Candidatus Omnitrophica bacterium]|nr:hypothetical protein [Candidatus Omnitrophota bacterium]
MKKIIFQMMFGCVLLIGVGRGVYAAEAGEPGVRIIKLSFAHVYDVATVLTAMKGPDGKVIANEEGKSVVLMDTPDKVRAMEAVIRQMDVQTVTAVIPLKFSRANEVLDSVRALLTQSVGVIAADMAANTITVTDTPVTVERVRRAVEALDPRGRKIVLEAKLVHVVLDDEHLDGVDWSGIVADHQNFRLEGQYRFLGGKGKGEALSLGTIESPDFVPLIEALDTVGIVKEYPVSDVPVMSDTDVRMVVRLDEPDVSMQALTPGVLAQGMVDPAGQDLQGQPPVEGAVMEFLVKPQVDVDGSLKTVITEKIPSGKEPSRSPIFDRRAHSVVVRSLEGGSIVIGGLIATEQVLTQRKIPLMGDLPLLGFAFRYHNSTVRREEFVIMLTPKIVSPENAAGESSEAAVQAPEAAK